MQAPLVIPGPAQRARAKSRGPMTGSGRSPESIIADVEGILQRLICTVCGYGFRARRSAAPRNDEASLLRPEPQAAGLLQRLEIVNADLVLAADVQGDDDAAVADGG